MKVQIESNGQPRGTRILAGDRDISNWVYSVIWRHRAGEAPQAELELLFMPLIGPTEAKMIGPNGKPVKRIEYEDGTVDEF